MNKSIQNERKTLQDAQGAVDMLAHLLAMGHVSEAILPYADQQEWKDHLQAVKAQLGTLIKAK